MRCRAVKEKRMKKNKNFLFSINMVDILCHTGEQVATISKNENKRIWKDNPLWNTVKTKKKKIYPRKRKSVGRK